MYYLIYTSPLEVTYDQATVFILCVITACVNRGKSEEKYFYIIILFAYYA